MPITIDPSTPLAAECEAIWAATQAQASQERRRAQVPELVRLWDGEWMLHHVITYDNSSSFGIADADTAPATIELDTLTPAAQWALDMQARIDRGEMRNVHLTVDYASGERTGYRMHVARQQERDDGSSVVVLEFLSDHEEFKYRYIKPNTFLPAWFQMPRLSIIPGPTCWTSSTALFLDIFREHNPLITFPDDPGDLGSWVSALDQSEWSVVVKPISFLEDMAAGTVWSIVTGRWDNYHDRMKTIWRDAEVTPVLRRYLAGDEPPWPGADLRHGALVVSFEDRSGHHTGTSHGGSIFDGLLRTFLEPAEGLVDSTLALVTGATIPAEYYEPGGFLTHKELPYCVYLAGENTGIQEMEFCSYPGTAVNLSTGGHSMPGVNEAISAAIQAVGDIVGDLLQIGSIGGAVDTILRPIYEDTVLAWIELKLHLKAQTQGWSRYWEQFIDSAGKAYTIDSVMVLRAGAWATRPYETVTFKVRDGHPFLVGIHFWIGHRIGATRRHDKTGRIYINRASKLTRTRSRDDFALWEIEMGDPRTDDPAAAIWERMQTLTGAVRTLGVW